MALALRTSPVGPLEPSPGVIARLSNWAVTPWPVPYPIWPATQAESDTVPTVVPSIAAVRVLPLSFNERLCQRPVPSAAVLPLARVR